MASLKPLLPSFTNHQIKVWVLAPLLETADANIDYYYDFSQSIAEYDKTFAELGIEWKWQPVTVNNYFSIIDLIVKEKDFGNKTPVVFNLCDGDEINGTPGISVVKLLEEKGLIYRQKNPDDGRGVLIYLTDLGKQMREQSKITVLKFNDVVKQNVPEEKLQHFMEVADIINIVVISTRYCFR